MTQNDIEKLFHINERSTLFEVFHDRLHKGDYSSANLNDFITITGVWVTHYVFNNRNYDVTEINRNQNIEDDEFHIRILQNKNKYFLLTKKIINALTKNLLDNNRKPIKLKETNVRELNVNIIHKFDLKDNDGDGNCLYLALSDGLKNIITGADIRKRIYDFYKDGKHLNNDYFSAGAIGSDRFKLEKGHIDGVGHDAYGTDIEIMVFVYLYERNVGVYNKIKNGREEHYQYSDIGNIANSDKRILLHLENTHYKLMVPKKTMIQTLKNVFKKGNGGTRRRKKE